MFSLPIECLVGIVQFLSVQDSLKFTSTCKYLHYSQPYDTTLRKILERVHGQESPVDIADVVALQLDDLAFDELQRLLFFLFPTIKDETVSMLICGGGDIAYGPLIQEMMTSRTYQRQLVNFSVTFCEYLMEVTPMDIVKPFVHEINKHVVRYSSHETFDEDLYYRLSHVEWHDHERHDSYRVSKRIVDLERFIHLAILTDNPKVYEELVLRRYTVFNNSILEATHPGLAVTDQDVYTIIRYASSKIFYFLKLQLVKKVRPFLDMCELECQSCMDKSAWYGPCGLCLPRPTLLEQYEEKLKRLTDLRCLLP